MFPRQIIPNGEKHYLTLTLFLLHNFENNLSRFWTVPHNHLGVDSVRSVLIFVSFNFIFPQCYADDCTPDSEFCYFWLQWMCALHQVAAQRSLATLATRQSTTAFCMPFFFVLVAVFFFLLFFFYFGFVLCRAIEGIDRLQIFPVYSKFVSFLRLLILCAHSCSDSWVRHQQLFEAHEVLVQWILLRVRWIGCVCVNKWMVGRMVVIIVARYCRHRRSPPLYRWLFSVWAVLSTIWFRVG